MKTLIFQICKLKHVLNAQRTTLEENRNLFFLKAVMKATHITELYVFTSITNRFNFVYPKIIKL